MNAITVFTGVHSFAAHQDTKAVLGEQPALWNGDSPQKPCVVELDAVVKTTIFVYEPIVMLKETMIEPLYLLRQHVPTPHTY